MDQEEHWITDDEGTQPRDAVRVRRTRRGQKRILGQQPVERVPAAPSHSLTAHTSLGKGPPLHIDEAGAP